MKKLIYLIIFIVGANFLKGGLDNLDKPQKGVWETNLKKIADLNCGGKDFFGGVEVIRTGKDGTIFIGDSKNYRVYIFNKDGKFIKAFGAKGEGPGEFKNLENLFVIDNMVIVSGRSQLNCFDNEGNFIKTVKLPANVKPRAFINRNLLISAPEVPVNQSKKSKLKLELYDLSKESRKLLAEYSAFDEARVSSKNMTAVMIVGGVTPLMVLSYHEGVLYYGMNDLYKINRIDLKGNSRGVFGISKRDKEPFSEARKKEIFAEVKGIPEATLKALVAGLPDDLTYFDSIQFDNDGFIYVLMSDVNDNEKKRVDIFSPEGKFLYKATLSFEEGIDLKNMYLDGNRFIVSGEDEDGDIQVGIYKLTLPTKG